LYAINVIIFIIVISIRHEIKTHNTAGDGRTNQAKTALAVAIVLQIVASFSDILNQI